MGLTAFLCIGIGVFPGPLYSILPYPVDYQPYTTTHVITQLQLLIFSALCFGFLKLTKLYPPELRSTNLDSDWVYRKALPKLTHGANKVWTVVYATGWAQIWQLVRLAISRTRYRHQPAGQLGEPWPTGQTALWAAILLGGMLLMSAF